MWPPPCRSLLIADRLALRPRRRRASAPERAGQRVRRPARRRRRGRGDVRGRGRRRLFQLHRLRAQHAPHVPRRVGGLMAARDPPRASSAKSGRKISTSCARTPPTSGVRPWSGHRLRHSGRPDPSIVRRLRPPRLPRHRQPVHRLPARLSVPDVAAAGRGAGDDRRSRRHARAGLARRRTRLARRSPARACRSSRRSDGTPAFKGTGRARDFDVTGERDERDALRSTRPGQQRRQAVLGTRRCQPVAGLIMGASAAHGDFLSDEVTSAPAGPAGVGSADRVRRRRRVLAGPLAPARRARVEPLEHANRSRRRRR